jgi:hypothetical protein
MEGGGRSGRREKRREKRVRGRGGREYQNVEHEDAPIKCNVGLSSPPPAVDDDGTRSDTWHTPYFVRVVCASIPTRDDTDAHSGEANAKHARHANAVRRAIAFLIDIFDVRGTQRPVPTEETPLCVYLLCMHVGLRREASLNWLQVWVFAACATDRRFVLACARAVFTQSEYC